MKGNKHNILLPLAIIIATMTALLQGCNTTGCTDNRSSLLLTGFYAMPTTATATPRGISVDSLEIGGAGAPDDSLLVNIKNRVSQVYLPLRSRESMTAFFIRYKQKALDYPQLVDTIRFYYRSEPYFASEECGAIYRYHITRLQYTRNLVDSVALTDSLINNANIERMKIMFRTAESETQAL